MEMKAAIKKLLHASANVAGNLGKTTDMTLDLYLKDSPKSP
jgi:hypothetical protein